VREANKKLIGFALAFIFLAMLATPVIAAPATKIEEVTLTIDAEIIPDPASVRYSDHNNVVHNKGIATGTATLDIPGQSSLSFTYYGIWSGRGKWTGFPTEADLSARACSLNFHFLIFPLIMLVS
jgi:hypothetical protein